MFPKFQRAQRWGLGLVAFFSFSAVAAPYTVIGDESYLRSGPGGEFGVVASIEAGAVVDVFGRQGNWLQVITADSRQGWLFRGLAQPVEHGPTSNGEAARLIDEWVGDYWLLVIGIDDYKHWPKLRNAVRDARALADLLVENYSFDPARVLALFNEQATEENIFREFLRLKEQLKPNDSLLVYFAGHGVLDEFDTASWVPMDARESAISDYIATDRINRILGKLPARHVFLVADACYSGFLFNQRRAASFSALADDRYFRENIRRYSRQALTSGGTEPVLDGGGANGHSVFAYYLLNELRAVSGPYISASTLSMRVQQLVARNSNQEPKWDHLVNVGDENGEFFFLRQPAASVERGGTVPEASSRLTLHTYPFGARLRVNGEMVGVAPITISGLAGTVDVVAELDGYHSSVESVRIRYDREQTLVLRLTPTEGVGSLVITTQPAGAGWYLNGAYMGMTPDRAVDILAGTHVLTVNKEGYPPWRQTVRLARDKVTVLKVDLAERESSGVSAAVAGAFDKGIMKKAVVVAAAQESVAQVARATSDSHDARRAHGIDQLEKLLGEFVGAYQLRDVNRLRTISSLSAAREAFLERIFKKYRDIELRLVSLEVTAQDATATVKIEKLTLENGDLVIPNPSWSSAHIIVNRDGDRWGKVQWH